MEEPPVEEEAPVEAEAEEGVPVEQAAEGIESEEEVEDELSSAIEELKEKIESDDLLLDPEALKIDEPSPDTESEYIDLSAELGMEEALEGLAGTWSRGEGESNDAFDEFKSSIGEQLSKEDTETHYNLGIAYMEMELYDEASKEFKIAIKDPRLEGDCYARLGLCAMAESQPGEAIVYYLKGLKVEGKTEDERKGMMYELALAYEAAGDIDEAFQLFTSIHDLDPSYREVEEKLSTFDRERPYIPADDGLIEVELL
ncbi:MAG: tetratricopeptide repeat protein [Thermodesulfobacteriota bacterium]